MECKKLKEEEEDNQIINIYIYIYFEALDIGFTLLSPEFKT